MNPISLRNDPFLSSTKRINSTFFDEITDNHSPNGKRQHLPQDDSVSSEWEERPFLYSTPFNETPVTSLNAIEESLQITTSLVSDLRTIIDNQQQEIIHLQNAVDVCTRALRNISKDEIEDTEGRCLYRGGTLNQLPHGKGTFYYQNGDVYKGNWLNGHEHGRGVVKNINGDVIKAIWENGVQKGIGKIKYHNFEKYKGNLQCGLPHGEGIGTDLLTNERYHGMWEEGKRHGKGILTDSKGNSLEGTWEKGKFGGSGTRIFATGNIFTGNFKDEEGTPWQEKPPHGHGTGIIKGVKYEGEWRDGTILISPDKSPPKVTRKKSETTSSSKHVSKK